MFGFCEVLIEKAETDRLPLQQLDCQVRYARRKENLFPVEAGDNGASNLMPVTLFVLGERKGVGIARDSWLVNIGKSVSLVKFEGWRGRQMIMVINGYMG